MTMFSKGAEMHGYDVATLVLAAVIAFGAYTASLVSLVIYLERRFRAIEKLCFSLMADHQDEDDRKFNEYAYRLQKLELNAFGFTQAP